MSQSSYNTQILATLAAAQITGNGASSITFGCSITRTEQGTYKAILPTGEGISEDQSFTRVQAKSESPVFAVVTDESAFIKTIRVFDNTGSSTPVDSDVEIVIERATINP